MTAVHVRIAMNEGRVSGCALFTLFILPERLTAEG